MNAVMDKNSKKTDLMKMKEGKEAMAMMKGKKEKEKIVV
jgi:hypothetical protein